MGWRDQINIVGAFFLQAEKDSGKFPGVHFPAESPAADREILAETAAKGTAAEKYSSASVGSADTGFFPEVKSCPGHFGRLSALAEAGLTCPVGAAHAGAQLTVRVSKRKRIGHFYARFH